MADTKGAVKSLFAPRQLATPTDLKPEEVRAVTETVNRLIADAFALYVKTKNFHWHVASSHFRDYHLLLDEQADAIFGSIDILAERVRRIGGTTIRSVSHIAELQTLEDDNEDFVLPEEMIRRLLADNRYLAESQRTAIAVCDQNRDTPTGNLLQEMLDQTEKRIWFRPGSPRAGTRSASQSDPASPGGGCPWACRGSGRTPRSPSADSRRGIDCPPGAGGSSPPEARSPRCRLRASAVRRCARRSVSSCHRSVAPAPPGYRWSRRSRRPARRAAGGNRGSASWPHASESSSS